MPVDQLSAKVPRTSTWTPTDILRLISNVGGFFLFALGVWMLYIGIATDGTVDLKSTILSGTLKTTSAGLYICFFALFIIIFVLVTLLSPVKATDSKAQPARSRLSRLMPVFWVLLAVMICSLLGLSFAPKGSRTGFAMAIGVFGVPFITVVTTILRMVREED